MTLFTTIETIWLVLALIGSGLLALTILRGEWLYVPTEEEIMLGELRDDRKQWEDLCWHYGQLVVHHQPRHGRITDDREDGNRGDERSTTPTVHHRVKPKPLRQARCEWCGTLDVGGVHCPSCGAPR